MLALLFVVSYRHVYFPAPPRGCFFPSGYCSLYFILFFLSHSNVRCKGYISLASHTLCDVSSGLQSHRLYLEAAHSPTYSPDAIPPQHISEATAVDPLPPSSSRKLQLIGWSCSAVPTGALVSHVLKDRGQELRLFSSFSLVLALNSSRAFVYVCGL